MVPYSLRTADAFPVVASLPPKIASKQKVLRHGNRFAARDSQTLFFGGREATTGNASAARRLGTLQNWHGIFLIS